jgi:polysaccharide biosynthesis transport protein
LILREAVEILRARKKRVFLVVFLFVAGALAASVLLPKSYIAQSAIVINSSGRDALTGLVMPTQLSPNSVATQVDIIASHNVALKVVDRLKLTESRAVQEQFQQQTGGTQSVNDWLADRLLTRLKVRPSRESNVITLEFSAADPTFAAELANAFAEAYIQASLELSVDPAKRQSDWFDTQLVQLRTNLQDAKQRLTQYQQTQSVVGTDDRLDVESSKLGEVSSQLVAAQAAMYEANTRHRQMTQALERGQIEQLPDILGNTLLQSMKADLARAEAKLAESAERYGRNHPQYISAAAEVKSLREKLASELRTAQGAIRQSAQIAQARVAELQRAQDRQKSEILSLKDQRNGADVLNREVESAQRAYDAVLQRGNEVRLQSQLNQSSVSVLNRAYPPIAPARPLIVLNVILGALIGTLLGVAFALLSESMDRRVRSPASLATTSGLLVLAEIPRLKGRRRKARLKKPVRKEIPVPQPA